MEILEKVEIMANIELEISQIIKELGIPANLMGYHYLKQAIEFLIEDFTLTDSVTKRLYPLVARQFNTRSESVERAMRYAILVGWLRGNVDLQQKLFGYTINAKIGLPSVSEFVVTVADYFHMLHKESE